MEDSGDDMEFGSIGFNERQGSSSSDEERESQRRKKLQIPNLNIQYVKNDIQ